MPARPAVDVLEGLTTAIIVDQQRIGRPSLHGVLVVVTGVAGSGKIP